MDLMTTMHPNDAGVRTLGLAGGSELTLESDTLQVEIAEEAYCPQYSSGNYQ
jgi:hypothetical protein